LARQLSEKQAVIREERGTFWSASSLRGAQRNKNSDALGISIEGPCRAFVVADGVGALERSPAASDAASQAVVTWMQGRERVEQSDAASLLASVDAAVGSAVDNLPGATTIVCALVEDDNGFVIAVGDSEALALDKHGPARRLNRLDHVPTQPNMLLAWIDGKLAIEPHLISLAPLPYRLVLATDGVTGTLDNDTIADIVRGADVKDAATALVRAARAKGAVDDATAIVVAGAKHVELAR
jgi:protein phosphatase